MLFDLDVFNKLLEDNNIHIHGVLHIGAHLCEEMYIYNKMNILAENVIWVEANEKLVDLCRSNYIPNIYCCTISDNDNNKVVFSITNNGQSSSILELGTHSQHYPDIKVIDNKIKSTTTIDTFFNKNNLDSKKYNLWNLDIQGAELKALKGGVNSLQHADAVYMEINIEEVYKGCALLEEIDIFMNSNNFKRVHAVLVSQGWGDALYVRKSV